MAQITMQRDRTPPRSSVSDEALIWDGAQIDTLDVPDTMAAGGQLAVSGTLSFDFGPVQGPVFPRDARITVRAGGDQVSTDLPAMGRQETRSWTVTLRPNSVAGQSLDVVVEAEGDGVIKGWQPVDTRQGRVSVQSEQQQQADRAFRYLPWVVIGGGAGAAYSSFQYGTVETPPVLGGAAAGVITRQYGERVGFPVPSLPDIPTEELAIVGGVALAGALLLNQGSRYVPGIE